MALDIKWKKKKPGRVKLASEKYASIYTMSGKIEESLKEAKTCS
jgi:hypothetical protein